MSATDRLRRSLGERALAGQTFCLGIAGEAVSGDEREIIRTLAPGAFLLARRNLASLEQATALVDELHALGELKY